MKGGGGKRAGAGRPLGSCNKTRLVHGLPSTPDPLQWLLALVSHSAAPMHLRLSAAVVLMPYCHARC